MCDFKNGFILCKCTDARVVVHNKKSRRNTLASVEFIWILKKFIGISKETEIGRYLMPVEDAGCGLTSDFVLDELNRRNCFDFSYIPVTGDNLIITNKNSHDRLEFIYKNGKWIADHYSPFNDEIEKFDSGKIAKLE